MTTLTKLKEELNTVWSKIEALQKSGVSNEELRKMLTEEVYNLVEAYKQPLAETFATFIETTH